MYMGYAIQGHFLKGYFGIWLIKLSSITYGDDDSDDNKTHVQSVCS